MDSLTFTDKLRDAGFNDRQASVIAQGVFEAVKDGVAAVEGHVAEVEAGLATKADLKSGLSQMESNLKAEIERAKFDLMKFFIIALAGFATVIVALEKLL